VRIGAETMKSLRVECSNQTKHEEEEEELAVFLFFFLFSALDLAQSKLLADFDSLLL
jgi:hypothetical protein